MDQLELLAKILGLLQVVILFTIGFAVAAVRRNSDEARAERREMEKRVNRLEIDMAKIFTLESQRAEDVRTILKKLDRVETQLAEHFKATDEKINHHLKNK